MIKIHLNEKYELILRLESKRFSLFMQNLIMTLEKKKLLSNVI
jgi:hypothetical protein